MARYVLREVKYLKDDNKLSLYTKVEKEILYLLHKFNGKELGETTLKIKKGVLKTNQDKFDTLRILNTRAIFDQCDETKGILIIYTCYGQEVGYDYYPGIGEGYYMYETCANYDNYA
jgi:hypothetical protein